ncbi:MAG: YDG domain-containing protein, partial [Cyclobacteriaceae bacterium]
MNKQCLNQTSTTISNERVFGKKKGISQFQSLFFLCTLISLLSVSFSLNAQTVAGVDWVTRSAAVDNNWSSVAYGNGLFVAVSSSGTGNRVMTSPDGIEWTSRSSAADNPWNSITYGNGLFVAVANEGAGNRVMTSPDGIEWTSRSSAADNSWNSVTYGNGLFVAVSYTGTGNRVMTSPDGIEWTSRTSAADNQWYSVIYGNDLFVAVARSGTGNRVMTSPDGMEWTSRTSAADNQWSSVIYGNGLFVVVSTSITGNRVMTSPDGIEWTSRTSAADNFWTSVTYGNGLYVAVATFATGNGIMTSPDGIEWTSLNTAEDFWNSVVYANGIFVAVANTGSVDRVMTSGTFVPPTAPTVTTTAITDISGLSATLGGNVTADGGATVSERGIVYATSSNPTIETGTKVQIGSGNGAFSQQVSGLSANTTYYVKSYAINSIGTSYGAEIEFTTTQEVTGVDWSTQSAATDDEWRSVTYGNGLFVAVSGSGTANRVMTSPDGIEWTSRSSAEDNLWFSVTYGNGLFVAIAPDGINRMMTSLDGIEWTSSSQASDLHQWASITYGNGLFVAVSADGTGNRVMTSPDGIAWTSHNAAAQLVWYSVTYGNGLFVAVSQSGTGNRVMTSPDGINWTSRSSAEDNNWESVTYGNGLFVAVATTGTGNRVMTSPDGIEWTSRTSAVDNLWVSVTYGDGLFVAVARDGTGNRVMTSPDGIAWTSRTSVADNKWRSVTYANGSFVAVANTGTGNRVMTSGTFVPPFSLSSNAPAANATDIATDTNIELTFASDVDAATVTSSNIVIRGQQSGAIAGAWSVSGAVATFNPTTDFVAGEVLHVEIGNQVRSSNGENVQEKAFSFTVAPADNATLGQHWAAVSAAEANQWLSVTYGNGKFVAVAQSGTNRVMYSEDGITWTGASATEANAWFSVTYGNGKFVAVSQTGTNRVMYSEDGITWTAASAAEANIWTSVTYGNGKFVGVTYSGTNRVMYSEDGVTWTAATAAEANQWLSVTYGNGKFVAVSNTGTNQVMYSEDGITWTAASAAEAKGWLSVTYGNGKFVAVAQDGPNQVMYSENGITWTAASANEANSLTSVTYGNGKFVAVTRSGTNRVMYSEDGVTWTAASAAEANAWYSVTYGNGRFVAVSASGTNQVMISRLLGPVFENSTPSSSLITQTGFTLGTDIDEAGTIYYVVVADGASSPSSPEVKAGTGNGGSGQISTGNAAVSTGDFTNDFSVTGLTAGTAYDVYVVAEDDEGTPNLQVSPTKIDVTTAALISLTITGLTGDNKAYDGTTTATASGTPSLSGVVDADAVSLGGSPVFTFASANVATGITIATTGYTISGTDAGKYVLTQLTFSADITAKALTITGLTGDDKAYDGTTAGSASGTASLSGIIGADDVSLGGSPVFTFANANVGTVIAINTTGYTLSGTAGGNYNLTQPTLSADITAKSLTVTGDANQTKVYGATDPTFTYTLTGSLETADAFTGSLARATGENVGTYAINIGTLSAGSNYNVTFAGSDFSITAKPITVTAVAATKVYGDADP